MPFSKNASPLSPQRKPNGKLSLLVDLRKVNTLLVNIYIKNKHPVSTSKDATPQMAKKNVFCKRDSCQAYHCLQMADQQSTELREFIFTSTLFAYPRLAQKQSCFLSTFSRRIRENLDLVIKANPCEQYFDDIGIAANTLGKLIKNI